MNVLQLCALLLLLPGCSVMYGGLVAGDDAPVDSAGAEASPPLDAVSDAADSPADASGAPFCVGARTTTGGACTPIANRCCKRTTTEHSCVAAGAACPADTNFDTECESTSDCAASGPDAVCCVTEDWPSETLPKLGRCVPRTKCGGRWWLCDPTAAKPCPDGGYCGGYPKWYGGTQIAFSCCNCSSPG